MPVFHTKTIEGILEPVAQQVSRLVILHEEAEDGNAMPDLERPVMAVSKAVVNLVKVGKETINSSDDPILKQDMPAALLRVESASRLLEEASSLLKSDPYSQPARKKLIEGARGILQGTSSLLLCFDESEVRKIIRECKKVLDYLAVAEVIETMDDLIQFVKDLSPCLTKVSREVDNRQQELTHQIHRDILIRCLDAIKTLSPILICSMKIFIQIFEKGGRGIDEAAENRNYLAGRMTDEINEVIRVLQLTTYDEDEWDADNLTVMKKALNAIDGKTQAAHDWLSDPSALRGGIGEKSVRQILEHANRVANRALPHDKDLIRKLCGDIGTMTNALCELRQDGKGNSPQGIGLARSIAEKLRELNSAVAKAVINIEKSGIQQPAHTVAGRLEQAQRWLSNPSIDDKGLGQQAIALIVEEGKKVAAGLTGQPRQQINKLCDDVSTLSSDLAELCRRGQGNTGQAQAIARNLASKLQELKNKIQTAVVDRVVEDFVDISSPLKHFTEAVLAPEGTPGRQQNFEKKANSLSGFSSRAAKTARMVAAGSAGGNKKSAEALLSSANQVESLTPQLIAAGRIRMTYPTNKAADEHFENLRQQYADSIQRVRDLADEVTDSSSFIKASEQLIKRHTSSCEGAISNKESQSVVDSTSAIARLANRVLMVAKQEAENSEDPTFVNQVNLAANRLQMSVAPMVQNAKNVAVNPDDQWSANKWRETNNELLNAVGDVRQAVTVYPEEPIIPPPPDMSGLHLSEKAPPRPPLPEGNRAPPRPPPPETDDEDESVFHQAPLPSQPIMMAAHGLHQEVKQWSSRDNEIIAAAKKMAHLMAQLSQLVRGEGGNKRDLIACAKAIAAASDEVTRLAKELARECTDKRMRTNLLQVCERIPTIATQLKILSTVKATMLGAQDAFPRRDSEFGSEEDQEATEMLVGNAQNLMQSVKETVRAAEAASIKIRTDAGIRLRWERKQPWFQY